MSYLSATYEQSRPPELGDVNLARSVVTSLQGKYDKNSAEIENTLAQYQSQLKGLRDTDNAYIAEKLRRVDAEINTYSKKNSNLAYASNKNNILGIIRETLSDPIVVDAVTSAQNAKAYDTQYAEMAKKDPKLANDANYAYGRYKGGYDEYISGKTNKLGAMQYTPYTDIVKEDLELLTKVKALKGNRKIQVPQLDSNGQRTLTMVEKSIDGLSKEEIREYFGGMMTSGHRQQLTINGWAKYQGNPEQAIATLTQLQIDRGAQVDLEIKQKQALSKSSGTTDETKAQLALEITGLEKTKQGYLDSADKIKTLPIDVIGGELESATYLNSLSNMASAEWNYEQKVDDIYKTQIELEYKAQDLDIKRQKLALDYKKEARESGVDPLTGSPTATIDKSTKEFDVDKDFNGMGNLVDMYSSDLTDMKQAVKNGITDPKDKEAFDELLRLEGINPNTMSWEPGQEMKNGMALYDVIQKTFQKAGLQHSYSNVAEIIDDKADNLTRIAKTKNSIDKDVYPEVLNKDPKKYIGFLAEAEEDLQPIFSFISDITGSKSAIKLKEDIKEFVKKTGGWNNMEQYLKNNPKEVSYFAELTDRADKEYKGIDPYIKRGFAVGVDYNLKEDAKGALEQKLQQQTALGNLGTTTSYNAFTVSSKPALERIINSIDVDKYRESGNGNQFDATKSITVYKEGDGIRIAQNLGIQGKNNYVPREASVFVQKGDASYNLISQYIGESEKEIKANYDFSNLNTSFAPVRPIMSDMAIKLENNSETKERATVVDYKYRSMQTSFFLNNPAEYVTNETISEVYTKKLIEAGYEKGEVDNFVKGFTDNITGMTLEVVRESVTIAGNKTPQLTFKVTGGNLSSTFTKATMSAMIPKELGYIQRYYPQTIISDMVLRTILENKKPLSTYVK